MFHLFPFNPMMPTILRWAKTIHIFWGKGRSVACYWGRSSANKWVIYVTFVVGVISQFMEVITVAVLALITSTVKAMKREREFRLLAS
jgi:hypothetical protein